MGAVYAYWLQGTGQELQNWAALLGSPTYFWVASLAYFHMGQGLPGDWLEQGGVFNRQGELRWWKGSNLYQALLFSEQEITGLSPLEGQWEEREKSEEVFLQDLTEPRVRPTFGCYPYGGTKGRLNAKVYLRDGMAVWISPRNFVSDQQEGQS
jgi:hypothetical protein